MSFPARFASRCGACGEDIEIGDQIKKADDDYDSLAYIHADCQPSTPIKQAEVCTNCFLEKPCPCEDDQ
jgi:hypothetical protein